MTKNFFSLAGLLLVLASANTFPAAAGEVYSPQSHRADVTLERYSPVATVAGVLATNGGAYAAAATNAYAVRALGAGWAVTSVASNQVVATGQLVRIQWKPVGGATNYWLVRNSTNYVVAGVVTQAYDYGTNAWAAGTMATVTAAVPVLWLPADGYTPTGRMAVRAQDVVGLSGGDAYPASNPSNYISYDALVQLSNSVASTAETALYSSNATTRPFVYGDGNDLIIKPRSITDGEGTDLGATVIGGGTGTGQDGTTFQRNYIRIAGKTNYVASQTAMSFIIDDTVNEEDVASPGDFLFDWAMAYGSHTEGVFRVDGRMYIFPTGAVFSVPVNGSFSGNGAGLTNLTVDLSTYATLADVQNSLTNIFVDIGSVPTQTQHGATRQMHISTNGNAYVYAPKGGTNWWRIPLEPIP